MVRRGFKVSQVTMALLVLLALTVTMAMTVRRVFKV
jgi:hypothetical protein